jgi:hypothetical protein
MTPRRTEQRRITVCSLLVIDSAHQARLSDILKATFRGRDPTLNLIVPQPSSARPRGMSLETCRPGAYPSFPGPIWRPRRKTRRTLQFPYFVSCASGFRPSKLIRL